MCVCKNQKHCQCCIKCLPRMRRYVLFQPYALVRLSVVRFKVRVRAAVDFCCNVSPVAWQYLECLTVTEPIFTLTGGEENYSLRRNLLGSIRLFPGAINPIRSL